MKKRSLLYLFGLAAMVLAVGLACQFFSTPTPEPVISPPTQQSQPQPAPIENPTKEISPSPATGNDSALVTFTDKNKYYQIDLPGNWTHTTSTDTNVYIDTFTSPDKNALIENIVYDSGKPVSGNLNGKFALILLNDFYSYTKKEGDIRISNDSIQQDGSERLTWTSKGGGYSGISYFEVRKKTAFLMLTIEWDDNFESTYQDTLNNVVVSYKIP